ncbi:hypothetical protein ACWC9U_29470 [Streptomyces sp. 900116325]
MTSPDDGNDVGPHVTVCCQGNASIGVRLCGRLSFDADSVPIGASRGETVADVGGEALRGDVLGVPASSSRRAWLREISATAKHPRPNLRTARPGPERRR